MKISTQFRLLIFGILIVPALIIISELLFRYFTEREMAENGRTEYNFMLPGEHNRRGPIFQRWNQEHPGQAAGDEPSPPREPPPRGYTGPYRNSGAKTFRIFFFPPVLIALVLILALIVFVIGMSIMIARSITRSVQVLEDATRRIAGGELDLAVDVRGSNEITSLTSSLNKMRDTLKEEERRRYRFIMGVTHDLKTPLALIKGYAEAIGDGITEDPSSRSGAAEIIAAKADQLEGMINDLIEFVRMDSGEWRGRLKEMNFTAFLNRFAAAMAADVELLRHTLTVDIDLPPDTALPMDERMVQRALENLVSNAVRYTPAGSVITLKAAPAGAGIQVQVRDNGPGIDKADLPHLFEMFYRGSSSRREQGMGLGLAVVKWVTDSHGWSITASSEPGDTCFTIAIP